MGELLWPVYECRPLSDDLRRHTGEVYRYADGQWVADDGAWDVAFALIGFGAPLAVYVGLPYQRNILWSWLTRHWSQDEPLHPLAPAARRGKRVLRWSRNPWHYQLRDGTTEWGGDWGRDRHPNRRAGDAAMSFVSGKMGCANGTGPQFNGGDPHIPAGLLRERETGVIVRVPEAPVCMYCGLAWRESSR